MHNFAVWTGLSDSSHPTRRYLWTDAFAVCNFLQLYQQTGKRSYLDLALKLVDQVHHILGKHRPDSMHTGWLSGLNDEQAELHPTKGGLRIGKRLNERQVDEMPNEALEWDQDGQYFHYLTKWMHALYCVSRVSGEKKYTQWAIELAKVAHSKFTYNTNQGKRMYWKMSIDLSRPLVSSMGQHDPLDGLITYLQLNASAIQIVSEADLSLQSEIADMRTMCVNHTWASADSLGIGSLLTDAFKLVQLINNNRLPETELLENLLRDIQHSLSVFHLRNQLDFPAKKRLAFRELGLAIGLQAVDRMQNIIDKHPEHFNNSDSLQHLLNQLTHYVNLHKVIEDFWLEVPHQAVSTWQDHININIVMLATSLAPDGYFGI